VITYWVYNRGASRAPPFSLVIFAGPRGTPQCVSNQTDSEASPKAYYSFASGLWPGELRRVDAPARAASATNLGGVNAFGAFVDSSVGRRGRGGEGARARRGAAHGGGARVPGEAASRLEVEASSERGRAAAQRSGGVASPPLHPCRAVCLQCEVSETSELDNGTPPGFFSMTR
jgi:hypothetical protein